MDPQRWELLQSLFRAALARPAEERRAFVSEACGQDDELARAVHALLRQDESNVDPVADIVQRSADSTLAMGDLQRAWIDRRLGPWRITAHLADGGMGAVYRAERADGEYQQEVAIKLINPAFVAGQAAARLAAERQILARLEHPHIARLLDGGTTEDGAPYLVMEYVDGTPVDEYCNRHGLDTRARLHLFQQVCAAVDYAHQRLVVHRDLKPANILVDRNGRPKLLDFGIAKLVEGAEATLTAVDQRVLTPTHASPEQIRGEPVTTATDVYALGVLLYQLLTGRLPFAFERGSVGSAAQLARQILEVEPRAPSATVMQDGNARLEAARRGGAPQTPQRLRRELKGDLDNIALMALRKEPVRRYRSVQALAEDVARYLADEPVSARRATTAYRLGKFVLRHRVGALASVAALLAATTLVAYYTWRLSLERDRAQQAAERAREQATRAEKVSEFLAGVFSVADPTKNLGKTVTARELLDGGARKIERDLAGEPEVQAALMEAMGDAYRNLGLYPEARDLQGKALDLRATVFGTDSNEYARSLARVGGVTNDLGKYDEAIATLQRSLTILRRTQPVDSLLVSRVLRNLADAQQQAGKGYAEAERNYRAAIDAAQAAGTAGDGERARAMAALGGVLRFSGKFGEARRWLEQALDLRIKTFGEAHPETIQSMSSLGSMLIRETRNIEAIALFERALPLARKVYGDDHISTAYVAANLANALNEAGRYAEAEQLMRRTLPVFRARLGEDHPRTAYLTENLANSIFYQGRYEEALAMYRESVAKIKKRFGAAHAEYGFSLSNLCGVYRAMERFDEVITTCREAASVLEKAFGPGHYGVVAALTLIGAAQAGQRKFEAAAATLRLAQERADLELPENHTARANLLVERARLLLARNRPAEGEPLVREALKIALANQPEGGVPVAGKQAALGELLTRLRRYDEAESMLLQSQATLRKALGAAHPDTQRVQQDLFDLYTAKGRPELAARYRHASAATVAK